MWHRISTEQKIDKKYQQKVEKYPTCDVPISLPDRS